MKTTITRFGILGFLLLFVTVYGAFAQTVIFSENFESGSVNTAWGVHYLVPGSAKGEDSLKVKPMAQVPKPLASGGNYVGWLQDRDTSFTGSAVAVAGAVSLKDYSIEADVYCYVNPSPSGYTGLVAYADSSKRDFYKLRVDFDVSNRINFSGLKSDTLTFLPLFSKDFTGANNPGVFPTVDGWHKMKIEIRNTSATQTTIWCYFDGTLLKNSPIVDTSSNRVTSGRFGLYSFQQGSGIAAYFDNIVVTSLPATSVDLPGTSTSLPGDFHLQQNYPNPFNPETRIVYNITESEFVSRVVFDRLGRTNKTLVSEKRPAGLYAATWNGTDNHGNPVPSGVYFYALRTGSVAETRTMVLLK
jgi:hypothetical protein